MNLIYVLPVVQRVEIATQTFQGLTAPDPDIEKAWAKEARRRLIELEEVRLMQFQVNRS